MITHNVQPSLCYITDIFAPQLSHVARGCKDQILKLEDTVAEKDASIERLRQQLARKDERLCPTRRSGTSHRKIKNKCSQLLSRLTPPPPLFPPPLPLPPLWKMSIDWSTDWFAWLEPGFWWSVSIDHPRLQDYKKAACFSSFSHPLLRFFFYCLVLCATSVGCGSPCTVLVVDVTVKDADCFCPSEAESFDITSE